MIQGCFEDVGAGKKSAEIHVPRCTGRRWKKIPCSSILFSYFSYGFGRAIEAIERKGRSIGMTLRKVTFRSKILKTILWKTIAVACSVIFFVVRRLVGQMTVIWPDTVIPMGKCRGYPQSLSPKKNNAIIRLTADTMEDNAFLTFPMVITVLSSQVSS